MSRPKQQTLAKFLSGGSELVNLPVNKPQTELNQNTTDTVLEPSEAKRSRPSRAFQRTWLKKFSWLHLTDNGGMVCGVCKRAGVDNAFTSQEGCTNFQNSTLVRHQESRSHIEAVKVLQLREHSKMAMQKLRRTECEQNAATVNNNIIQLRTVFVMAKNNIPADTFTDLMDMQIENGAPIKNFYKRPQVVSEMEQCIQEVAEEKLLDKIQASECVGIMLDETCDISIEKKLAVYIRFIENGRVTVSFLGNEHITDCTAAGIESALMTLLEAKNICDGELYKVFGLGTDGAAVMTGCHNGLGAKLKRRNKHIVQVHCVAHRLNLAVSQAGKSIEYCKNYHCMIHSLYKFYSDSSVRYDNLRELQSILLEKTKQITEPTSVRWLSVESAVKMIFQSYCAIILSLDADKSPKAVGISKFLSNSLFLLFTALLIDILTVIGILSLTFQRDTVNLSHIRHSVISTKTALIDMKQGSNKVDQVLRELGDVPEDGQSKYKEIIVKDSNFQRQRFLSLRETYIDKLVSNLDERFPEDVLNLLDCFDVVFNPNRYPHASSLREYGIEQFNKIIEFYAEFVNKDRITEQFLQFKHLVKSYNALSFESFLKLLINDFYEQYPDFVKLGKIALVIPVSSAPCERGFSIQNSIKNKVRNRLSPQRLNRLMFIKLACDSVQEFDFVKAAKMFREMKTRTEML